MPRYTVEFRRTFVSDDTLEFDAEDLFDAADRASDEAWGADVQLADLRVDLDGIQIYSVKEVSGA
jgi:hypothetical protein